MSHCLDYVPSACRNAYHYMLVPLDLKKGVGQMVSYFWWVYHIYY